MKKRIILTGGGTAGHITPNIALLPYLTEFEVHYVGQPDSMEEELLKEHKQVEFHPLKSVKFSRNKIFKNLAIPFKLLKAKKNARKLLNEIKPDVIFSKGGYVTLPVVLAAKKIPVIAHESDFSIGLANKLAVKKCRYVCTSFSHTAEKLNNGVCTGSPLRKSLYEGNKAKAESECRLTGRKNLLIFGGSLGATAINDVVFKSVNELTKLYDVVHIIGKNNKAEVSAPRYYTLPFTSGIADYFAWADLIVCRGGANALFELAALAKPSLVIPLPKGNSRGDQVDNAKYFEQKGYFKVLEQENLNKETLLKSLKELDENKTALIKNMKNGSGIDGTKKIVDLIRSLS